MGRLNKIFLEKVELSGYKSIDGVFTKFNRGLNIIIGKNAVGKTNFLKFLNNSLNFRFSHLNNFESNFTVALKDEKNYKFNFSKKTSLKFHNNTFEKLMYKTLRPNFNGSLDILESNNPISKHYEIGNEDQCSLFRKTFEEEKINIKSTLIKHGVPQNYLIVDKPLNIELINKTISDDFINLFNDFGQPNFFRTVFYKLLTLDLIESNNIFNKRLKNSDSILKHEKKVISKYKKDIIDDLSSVLSGIKSELLKYSPIQDIKVNDNFILEIDSLNEKVHLKNFYFEFYIDKKWYSFEDLSDGTKRIFYIISEIFIIERNSDKLEDFNILNVILIEEPELGVHPHQLYNLMRFIKEKSNYNQIVITTHSPLSLDILEKNELDCIIIAKRENNKTILQHLTFEKKEKAMMYMDQINLSDYWLNSDLED